MYPLELASKAGDCPFPPCHLGSRMGNLQVTLRFEKKWSISKLQSTWNNLPNYMEVIYSIFTFCSGRSNISSSHPQGQQLGLKVPLPALLGLYDLTLSCLPGSEKRSPPKNFCIGHGLSLSSPPFSPKIYSCCNNHTYFRSNQFPKLLITLRLVYIKLSHGRKIFQW